MLICFFFFFFCSLFFFLAHICWCCFVFLLVYRLFLQNAVYRLLIHVIVSEVIAISIVDHTKGVSRHSLHHNCYNFHYFIFSILYTEYDCCLDGNLIKISFQK